MPKPILLQDFGTLTDADGNLVRGEHGRSIPVATDQYSGVRFQLVCRETPGLNDAQRRDAGKKLIDSGAIYICSEDSGVRGWWEPVNEPKPAAIAPPLEPPAAATAQQ